MLFRSRSTGLRRTSSAPSGRLLDPRTSRPRTGSDFTSPMPSPSRMTAASMRLWSTTTWAIPSRQSSRRIYRMSSIASSPRARNCSPRTSLRSERAGGIRILPRSSSSACRDPARRSSSRCSRPTLRSTVPWSFRRSITWFNQSAAPLNLAGDCSRTLAPWPHSTPA